MNSVKTGMPPPVVLVAHRGHSWNFAMRDKSPTPIGFLPNRLPDPAQPPLLAPVRVLDLAPPRRLLFLPPPPPPPGTWQEKHNSLPPLTGEVRLPAHHHPLAGALPHSYSTASPSPGGASVAARAASLPGGVTIDWRSTGPSSSRSCTSRKKMTQGERPAIRRAKEELAWIPRGRVVVLQSCWEEKENMI